MDTYATVVLAAGKVTRMRSTLPKVLHTLAGEPLLSHVFFFQAEDGIRAHCVTGVQTCALPISRAKRVIDLAYEEARQLNNNYIGTEHLLLGLIAEGDGLAARVLVKLGADLERTRVEVRAMQD